MTGTDPAALSDGTRCLAAFAYGFAEVASGAVMCGDLVDRGPRPSPPRVPTVGTLLPEIDAALAEEGAGRVDALLREHRRAFRRAARVDMRHIALFLAARIGGQVAAFAAVAGLILWLVSSADPDAESVSWIPALLWLAMSLASLAAWIRMRSPGAHPAGARAPCGCGAS